ncbi:c-type cytochrome [Pseudaminobacter sp. NGMCC 1.201702]|uniref:c-type cytochrome n=1 Tax=Pseudaminobacter sp. NGMCC 1.201702 TaxID=3391825 RepID=UPI0039EE8E9C
MKATTRIFGAGVAAAGAVTLAAAWLFGTSAGGETDLVTQGRLLYAANCASCHSARLEG